MAGQQVSGNLIGRVTDAQALPVTDVRVSLDGPDLPYNFVKAIEVKQAGYQAEYGQALGGLINVVTRSGTPEFQWSTVGFFSGSGVSADANPIPNVLSRASFTDFDLGLSVSGPLIDPALRFFAAYNPRFVTENIALQGLGLQEATITKHMFAGKLDWRPSDIASASCSSNVSSWGRSIQTQGADETNFASHRWWL